VASTWVASARASPASPSSTETETATASDVRRAELGAEVVAVLTEFACGLAGHVEVSARLLPVTLAGGDDTQHEMERAPKGDDLRLVGAGPLRQDFRGGSGDVARLSEVAGGEERVCHPELPCVHLQRIAGLLGQQHRSVGGDPCAVRLGHLGQQRGGGLVRSDQQPEVLASFGRLSDLQSFL